MNGPTATAIDGSDNGVITQFQKVVRIVTKFILIILEIGTNAPALPLSSMEISTSSTNTDLEKIIL